MDSVVLFSSLYFAIGAAVGQLHLLRCPSCSAQFGTWTHHAKYIAASAMVGVPMTLIGFIGYWFSPCERE